jgi:hypothetical protein
MNAIAKVFLVGEVAHINQSQPTNPTLIVTNNKNDAASRYAQANTLNPTFHLSSTEVGFVEKLACGKLQTRFYVSRGAPADFGSIASVSTREWYKKDTQNVEVRDEETNVVELVNRSSLSLIVIDKGLNPSACLLKA